MNGMFKIRSKLCLSYVDQGYRGFNYASYEKHIYPVCVLTETQENI